MNWNILVLFFFFLVQERLWYITFLLADLWGFFVIHGFMLSSTWIGTRTEFKVQHFKICFVIVKCKKTKCVGHKKNVSQMHCTFKTDLLKGALSVIKALFLVATWFNILELVELILWDLIFICGLEERKFVSLLQLPIKFSGLNEV